MYIFSLMGGDCLKQLFSQLSETQKHLLLDGTGKPNVVDLVTRIPKQIHFQTTKEIEEKCKLEGITLFTSSEFDDKEDHGDIDIYYTGTYIDLNQIIRKVFDPLVMKKNGHVTTFSYKHSNKEYFQVDFIYTANPTLATFFFSYGDIGMTMGMIAFHNKLKYGDNGLFLKISGDKMNSLLGTSLFNAQEEHLVELTRDSCTIALFFGLSYERWESGFESMNCAYNWLSQSTLYNPHHFVPDDGKLKRHDKPKRKFMTGFEEYSRFVLKTYVEVEKIDMVEYVFRFFGNRSQIMNEIQVLADKRKLNNERATKFTGKSFVDKGVLGKDVGIAINKFQNYITEGFQLEFNTWLDNSNKEHVTETFEHFFHENYENWS